MKDSVCTVCLSCRKCQYKKAKLKILKQFFSSFLPMLKMRRKTFLNYITDFRLIQNIFSLKYE